jgi:predicted RNase H-like HicB family nuclease
MYLQFMIELIFIAETSPDGGFVAKCVSESIITQADTIEELKEAIIDAIHCHFDDNEKRTIKLQTIREEIIAA